jgi:hypothetical protein
MRLLKVLVLVTIMFCFLVSVPAMAADSPQACWKKTSTRGVGTVPNCDSSKVKDAGLCYTPCKDGYKGVGPVCWQKQCPAPLDDQGALCGKTIKKDSYGRGVGKPMPCNAEHPDKQAGLCYTACKAGYKGVGPVCWMQCPAGLDDQGALCGKTIAKNSYTRGVGTVGKTCPSNKPQFQAGLCYKPCPAGFKGVGPVCWRYCTKPDAKAEGVTMPTECGAACATTKGYCANFTADLVKAGLKIVADVVQAIASEDPEPLADLPEQFEKFMDTPLCE